MDVLLADIIAIHGKSLISTLISGVSGPISHVGLVTDVPAQDYAEIQVTQALYNGVRAASLATTVDVARYGYIIRDNKLTATQRASIATWAANKTGTGYAYINLLWQALDIATGHHFWTQRFDAGHRTICSELVANAYLRGANVSLGVSPRDCTPTDCLNWAISHDTWSVIPITG